MVKIVQEIIDVDHELWNCITLNILSIYYMYLFLYFHVNLEAFKMEEQLVAKVIAITSYITFLTVNYLLDINVVITATAKIYTKSSCQIAS